jgi:hypothetical protein
MIGTLGIARINSLKNVCAVGERSIPELFAGYS